MPAGLKSFAAETKKPKSLPLRLTAILLRFYFLRCRKDSFSPVAMAREVIAPGDIVDIDTALQKGLETSFIHLGLALEFTKLPKP